MPCFTYLKDKPTAGVFSSLLAFVSAVAVLMFLLAVRSQALLQAQNKSMFSSVLWSGGFTAWCVCCICSLPSASSSKLMAHPFCTHSLVKVEYKDEVVLPWSEGFHQLPSPPAAQGMQGMSTGSVCSVCDVAAVLRSNSCRMGKGTFNKTPTIYRTVYLRSWVDIKVITLMKLERCHAAVVFIFVWPLFITLLLLGPLLYFPVGAKHS